MENPEQLLSAKDYADALATHDDLLKRNWISNQTRIDIIHRLVPPLAAKYGGTRTYAYHHFLDVTAFMIGAGLLSTYATRAVTRSTLLKLAKPYSTYLAVGRAMLEDKS